MSDASEYKILCEEFAKKDAKLKELTEDVNALKQQIRVYAEGLQGRGFVEEKDRSLYQPVAGHKVVRVTRAQDRLSIDAPKLLEVVGQELFHEICSVKTVEFHEDKWHAAVAEERAHHGQLQECMVEKPSTWPVAVVQE